RQLTEKYEGAAPTGENPKRPHGLSADLLQQPGEPTRQPSPTYDALGNLTYDSYHHYTWDSDTSSVTVDSIGLTFDARVEGYPVVPRGCRPRDWSHSHDAARRRNSRATGVCPPWPA
ncbi:MAG: hypothetical protein WCD04_04770, partial [Terriglobia bacterium]